MSIKSKASRVRKPVAVVAIVTLPVTYVVGVILGFRKGEGTTRERATTAATWPRRVNTRALRRPTVVTKIADNGHDSEASEPVETPEA